MINDLLMNPLFPWQDGAGPEGDIVLSSRVQLGRNIAGRLFPERASQEELEAVFQIAADVLPSLDGQQPGTYELVPLEELSPVQREALVERHITTARHIARPHARGLLLRRDGGLVICINGENHFSIQAVAEGLQVAQAWEEASQVDDAMESTINFAFRDDFGYLTANPAATGTALQAMVTLHLPALAAMKHLSRIVRSITKVGFSVRGLYNGLDTGGSNIFQITNVTTLGRDEQEIVSQLEKIAAQVAAEERACREALAVQEPHVLQDRLCRSFGILSQARLMSDTECVGLLSDLRLAIDLGFIRLDRSIFEVLLCLSGAAAIQLQAGQEGLTEDDLSVLRAQILRRTLAAQLQGVNYA